MTKIVPGNTLAIALILAGATTVCACDCTPIEISGSLETGGDGSLGAGLQGELWKGFHGGSAFPLNWERRGASYAIGYETAYLLLAYVAWGISSDIFFPDGPGTWGAAGDAFAYALAVPFVITNFQIDRPLFGTRAYLGIAHQLSHFNGDHLVEKLGAGVGYRVWKYLKISGHALARFDRDGFSPSYRVGIRVGEYAK